MPLGKTGSAALRSLAPPRWPAHPATNETLLVLRTFSGYPRLMIERRLGIHRHLLAGRLKKLVGMRSC